MPTNNLPCQLEICKTEIEFKYDHKLDDSRKFSLFCKLPIQLSVHRQFGVAAVDLQDITELQIHEINHKSFSFVLQVDKSFTSCNCKKKEQTKRLKNLEFKRTHNK